MGWLMFAFGAAAAIFFVLWETERSMARHWFKMWEQEIRFNKRLLGIDDGPKLRVIQGGKRADH